MKKLFLLLSICQLVYSESQHKIHFLFPIPQSTILAKETVLVIRFEQLRPGEISNLHSFIELKGSKSGDIYGETIVCTDQKTINFKPNEYFILGERITVTLSPKLAGKETAFLDSTYYFDVSPVTGKPTHIKEKRCPGGHREEPHEKREQGGIYSE